MPAALPHELPLLICPKADCSAISAYIRIALRSRPIAHVAALPYGKAIPRASTLPALPHGRAFGQKGSLSLGKASKNYIYQNKRGDNFYKIIIPRSCFKEITKLLNFCEFKKLIVNPAVMITYFPKKSHCPRKATALSFRLSRIISAFNRSGNQPADHISLKKEKEKNHR